MNKYLFGNIFFITTLRSMSSKKTIKKNKQKQTSGKCAGPTKKVICAEDSLNSAALQNSINFDKLGNILLKIHAKPGAKQNAITDIANESIGIQIQAPPIDGEANTELIKYLSKILELKKSALQLDKGSKSRDKVVIINKDSAINIERVIELLQNECHSYSE